MALRALARSPAERVANLGGDDLDDLDRDDHATVLGVWILSTLMVLFWKGPELEV